MHTSRATFKESTNEQVHRCVPELSVVSLGFYRNRAVQCFKAVGGDDGKASKRIGIILVALMLLVRTACAEPPLKREVHVGVILGLTGPAATHSEAMKNGLQLAREELERDGWLVDLRFEDDRTEPKQTVSAFRFLISKGYRLFVGPTWSYQANAIRSLVRKEGVVALVPGGSSEINGGPSEGLFNLCPSRQQQEPHLREWLAGRGFKRAFIYVPNGDWGEVHSKVFQSAAEGSGLELIGNERFEYGIDVTTISTTMLKASAKGVDVVFVTGAAGDVANVVKARNLGNRTFSIVSTEDIRDALSEGLIEATSLTNVYSTGLALSSDFLRRYEARFGRRPSLYSDRAYDALKILAQAVAGSDGTPLGIRKYLQEQVRYEGAFGPITFDSNGDVRNGRYQVTSVSD